MHVCMYVSKYVCVCDCVCVYTHAQARTYIHTCIPVPAHVTHKFCRECSRDFCGAHVLLFFQSPISRANSVTVSHDCVCVCVYVSMDVFVYVSMYICRHTLFAVNYDYMNVSEGVVRVGCVCVSAWKLAPYTFIHAYK